MERVRVRCFKTANSLTPTVAKHIQKIGIDSRLATSYDSVIVPYECLEKQDAFTGYVASSSLTPMHAQLLPGKAFFLW